MRALSVPFHFTTTFLLAVGAYAAVWLALSRERFSPDGWGRWLFALGWLLLAAAETIHGALFVVSDQSGLVEWLRVGAYLCLLVSLLPTVLPERPGGGEPTAESISGARRASAAGGATAGSVVKAGGPAVLGLGAAVVALRSRMEGARRLALALGLLGGAELFIAHHGGLSGNPNGAWYIGHGLQLLAGIALGWWLWRAFRVSIQARFVAALVLLLIMVIALISFTFTQVFARGVQDNAYSALESAANFETSQLSGLANAEGSLATLLGAYQPVGSLVQAKDSVDLQNIAAPPPTDFLGFLLPDRSYLAFKVTKNADQTPKLDPLEVVNLSGNRAVTDALKGQFVQTVDDIGLNPPKLVLLGAAPVLSGAQIVGAVVAGRIFDASVLGAVPLAHQQVPSVLDVQGHVVASGLPGISDLLRLHRSSITNLVVADGQKAQFEASLGSSPYYVYAAPLQRPEDKRVVGAVVVIQPATVQSTEADVSRALFLGAIAATLFAVGASTVSGFRMTRPIRELTAAAQNVRRGDLTARVVVGEDEDEVAALGQAFNQMTASLFTQAGELREAAVAESRLRGELETILQSMTDGLIAVDLEARVVTVNREAERITGVGALRARGKPLSEVLGLVDQAGTPFDLPVYRLEAGSAEGFMPSPRPDTTGMPVAVTSAPIVDNRGSIRGAVAVVRDRTSELAVEQMKTEFLSNISHELRTPLTPIKGYADLLRRKVVSRAETVSFLNVILASTERMERIVGMLVNFSAMQAGRLKVATIPFDLDPATEEIVAKWQEQAPNHTLERVGFGSLPKVAGDPQLLPSAINELLDNAVKFSPDGGTIQLLAERDTTGAGDRVRVSVVDHGIGMSSEQMRRITQDFVQVDPSETRAFGGLGLGLAYVRRIIEAHRGELQVQSRPGEGSKFSLLIPVYRLDGGSGPGSSGGPDVSPTGGVPGGVSVAPLRRTGFHGRRTPPERPEGR